MRIFDFDENAFGSDYNDEFDDVEIDEYRDIMIRLLTSRAVRRVRRLVVHQVYDLMIGGVEYVFLHEMGSEIETTEVYQVGARDLLTPVYPGEIYLLYAEVNADICIQGAMLTRTSDEK